MNFRCDRLSAGEALRRVTTQLYPLSALRALGPRCASGQLTSDIACPIEIGHLAHLRFEKSLQSVNNDWSLPGIASAVAVRRVCQVANSGANAICSRRCGVGDQGNT